jgi:hypothetical protein
MERLKIGLVGIGAFGQVRNLSCPLETTRKFALAAHLAFESAGRTRPIHKPCTEKRNEEGRTAEHLSQSEDCLCIRNIESIIEHAVMRMMLSSEIRVEWARSTQPIPAKDYREFKLFDLGQRGFEEQYAII